jgi:hypothetical protein
MFDLTKCDTFHEGDVLLTFKIGDDETKAKMIPVMASLGLYQWAYSKREDDGCEQYLFVADYEQRKVDHLRSCMNSLSLPESFKAKLSELAS